LKDNILRKIKLDFKPGDTNCLSLRIREGDKETVQPFQGLLFKKQGTGMGKTFTVRKSSGNIYVERIFPLHSPMITAIKIVRRGKVRRAKLFYLRGVTGKSSRIKEKK